MAYSANIWVVFDTRANEIYTGCTGHTRRQALSRFLITRGCFNLNEMTDEQIEDAWSKCTGEKLVCTIGKLYVEID